MSGDKEKTAEHDDLQMLCLHYQAQNVKEAIQDESKIRAMHDELEQFVRNDVWMLVPRPEGINDIGTKWIFHNKWIIFGSTSEKYVKEFIKLMQEEFEMSMVGEKLFLGLANQANC